MPAVAASSASTRTAIEVTATAVMSAELRRATSPGGKPGAGIGTHQRAALITAMPSVRAARVDAVAWGIMVPRT